MGLQKETVYRYLSRRDRDIRVEGKMVVIVKGDNCLKSSPFILRRPH